ncbi:MAG TPA: 50S ribosomal protein L29 [Candidatus Xenobia bacterium]
MKVKQGREKMRESTPEELLKSLQDRKEELFNLRFQLAVGQNKNNAKIQETRRAIARLRTIMREKELSRKA